MFSRRLRSNRPERALADDQSESVAEQEAQTLMGKRMKALQINRQRMNARSKRRLRGDHGRRSFDARAAMRAAAGEAPVADDVGLDRRHLDLVIFADQFTDDCCAIALACRRRATRTRRIARNGLACGRGTHRHCRPADDCAAHARASPRQDASSRVSLSCRWTEASTNCATFYPVVEAGSPVQSARPCSGAANQSDPCAHGFRDCAPRQGSG